MDDAAALFRAIGEAQPSQTMRGLLAPHRDARG